MLTAAVASTEAVANPFEVNPTPIVLPAAPAATAAPPPPALVKAVSIVRESTAADAAAGSTGTSARSSD
jgi:hypothetical protein